MLGGGAMRGMNDSLKANKRPTRVSGIFDKERSKRKDSEEHNNRPASAELTEEQREVLAEEVRASMRSSRIKEVVLAVFFASIAVFLIVYFIVL